jgi:hypothetical protein
MLTYKSDPGLLLIWCDRMLANILAEYDLIVPNMCFRQDWDNRPRNSNRVLKHSHGLVGYFEYLKDEIS